MKPSSFAYAKALSIAEAVGLLDEHGGDARIIAGGQSLVALLNMRLSAPAVLVDINGIDGMADISLESDHLRIGALVRYADALDSGLIARHAPLLAKALPHVAHPAIRNRGTLGGALALADPAAEMPACLLALGGFVEATGPNGARRIAADDFFLGLYETALAPNEVLTAILLPLAQPDSRFAFHEIARRHGDYALVGLAASARLNGFGLTDIRLVYFSVGPTPIRPRAAERALEKGISNGSAVEAGIAALRQELDLTGDLQASAKLKLHLAGELLRRAAADLHGEKA